METIITADACVNHNGSFDVLVQMLEMVHKVQVVTGEHILFKMQKRNPELYSEDLYNSWVLNKYVPYKEHKAALEFGLREYAQLDGWCKAHDMGWYASVFDYDSLDFIASNFPHLKHWKIASPVTAEMPDLARAICCNSGTKYISSGMCTLEELDRTVDEVFKVTGEKDVILMHCVSMYPTPDNRVNLEVMDALGSRYGLKVGYSSHDAGIPISVAAVACGACAIEKHITLNRAGHGPDHALSIEYRGLETLVKHIQAVESAMGTNNKQYYQEEKDVRNKVRITKCAKDEICTSR